MPTVLILTSMFPRVQIIPNTGMLGILYTKLGDNWLIFPY